MNPYPKSTLQVKRDPLLGERRMFLPLPVAGKEVADDVIGM